MAADEEIVALAPHAPWLDAGVAALPYVTRLLAHMDVTRAGGGHGAVREACELIMQAQGSFDTQLAAFLA